MQIDLDLGELGFSEGGHLLVKRALRKTDAGQSITVTGTAPEIEIDLRAWCRDEGHTIQLQPSPSNNGRQHAHVMIVNGGAETKRWTGAQQAGRPDAGRADSVVAHPPRRWGLAARGATVEAGTPEFDLHLVDKPKVCADAEPRLSSSTIPVTS